MLVYFSEGPPQTFLPVDFVVKNLRKRPISMISSILTGINLLILSSLTIFLHKAEDFR